MRIFYNLDCARPPLTGVGYYAQNIVLAMAKYYPELDIIGQQNFRLLNKEEMMALFEKNLQQPDQSNHHSLRNQLTHVVNQFSWARSAIQWKKNLTYSYLLKNKLRDYIYHEPNFVFYPHDGLKVLTVHDVGMFDHPEYLPPGRARFLQQQMRHSMAIADALLVSCQFTKKRLLELTSVDEQKIHILAPPAKNIFKPRNESETQPYLDKFSLTHKKYILCVATLEPRKNLTRLIHAYCELSKDLRDYYPLVLVGNKGWMYDELMTTIQKKNEKNIHLLRYIDEETLLRLYSGANIFVFPSLYEGFGTPVLEAMQSGVPVITSNVSSLPEVCGESGVLIDPHDTTALTQAMTSLLTASSSRHQQLVENSLKRSTMFSWESFAKKLFDVYRLCNQQTII